MFPLCIFMEIVRKNKNNKYMIKVVRDMYPDEKTKSHPKLEKMIKKMKRDMDEK
jgi:precorrin-3B methylase